MIIWPATLASIYQRPGCDNYDDFSKCASGLLWMEFNRPIGPNKCPAPDGGRQVSKQQFVAWAYAAMGSW